MLRTVLKTIGAIVLLAIVVGVSYIKSSRSAKKESELRQGFDIEKKEFIKDYEQSFLKQLSDSSQYYIDSIIKLDSYYLGQIDSLNEFYNQRESTLLADLKANRKINSAPKKDSQSKSDTFQNEVRYEYQERLKSLPDDLTAYEKRVSYNEIVVELSRKYMISPDSLERLIE